MKASMLAVVLFAVIGVALCADLRDGRPGCQTQTEMQQIYYRNLWDANAYWKCEELNVPAKAVRCAEGGFQQKLKKCVDWEDWEWEIPVAPPSKGW